MRLLFLSKDNLEDRFFIKDLVHNMTGTQRTIILHELFSEKQNDNRFLTKRISSLLSEAMVYHNAFSGDQRGIISFKEGKYHIKKNYLLERFNTLPVILLNSLAETNDKVFAAPALDVALAILNQMEIRETLIFTRNPKSPLAAGKIKISDEKDFSELSALYEEEKIALENAYFLRPAILASPVNFAK